MARNRVKLTTTYPHGGKLHRELYTSFAEAYQGLSVAGFLNFSGSCGSKVPNDTADFIIEPINQRAGDKQHDDC